jgi:mannose-6-phosphate isomerase-like protein (cupin superfamily)
MSSPLKPASSAPIVIQEGPFSGEARPWGNFLVLRDEPHYKLKQLQVTPGHRLSLQKHNQREEHWLVTRGTPEITVGERTWVAHPGEYIHIPKQAQHRLANLGSELVELIEVQLGEYFGEDDIIRLQDDYAR